MKITELRAKDTSELSKILNDTQKDLVDARRGLAAGELANPRAITQHRKDIARIMTVLSENVSKEKEA